MKTFFIVLTLLLLGSPLTAALLSDGTVNISCSAIQEIRVRGNSDSNPYFTQVILPGGAYTKRFLPPEGFQKATQFARELKSCSSIAFNYNLQSREVGEFLLVY